MSFSTRRRLKSRREKYKDSNRKLVVVMLWILLALIIYISMNWADVKAYVNSFFY